jgi:hypothetical protein
MKIGHFYADDGVESEPLSAYGDVVRVGWDVRENDFSEAIKADARRPPFAPDTFDLTVWHPPCDPWKEVPDPDVEKQIDRARELATELGDEYIIENQPPACDDPEGLHCPPGGSLVTFSGQMFGLPVEYRRSFEVSFPVDQPPTTGRRPEHRVQNTGPKSYWKAVKGVTGDYRSQQLILSGTPASYIHHIMRHYPAEHRYAQPDEQTTLAELD